jgi:hypothetical protein
MLCGSEAVVEWGGMASVPVTVVVRAVEQERMLE